MNKELTKNVILFLILIFFLGYYIHMNLGKNKESFNFNIRSNFRNVRKVRENFQKKMKQTYKNIKRKLRK